MRTRKIACCGLAAALLGACQSLDEGLGAADRALSVVKSPSVRALAGIARSGDPEAALREGLKRRAALYERDPRALVSDLRALRRDYARLEAFLTGKASGAWGKKDARLPGRTRYVKYTQNYKSRAIVDFDAGEITVETVDEANPRASLKSAIVTTLLTPEDPRAVDLYSDRAIELTSDREPYLYGLVHDHRGRPVGTPAAAESFAEHLVGRRAGKRRVEVKEGARIALFVKLPLVENFENRQAEKYKPLVDRYAAKYRISPSLVYAIIRTESNFNPFAVSPAPAYGLMQLVPASGGRDAYRHARGRDEIPTRDYLFDPANNIELGTAYLDVLSDKQLDLVANPVSREYCVISAYNTGAGNVLRTFAKDRVDAVNRINRLEPPGVYERLRKHLPYAETRRYLVKVVSFRRQFLAFED